MLKKIVLYFMFILIFASCSSEHDHRLKISTTNWVGYSPLFYAKEKGWLEDINIKLVNVSSLAENMYIFQSANSHAYVGTQYEYSIVLKEDPSLVPIILFDRSYGGDVIMSNTSIEELNNNRDIIDVYLEIDSINLPLFQEFVKKYALENRKFNYINIDQPKLSTLKAKNMNRASVLVTYIPYNDQLKKSGFKEVANTKDSIDLLVIDAMYTRASTLKTHQKQFAALKELVDKAVTALKNDPKEFYETIKPNILEITYEEFIHSLSDIIWINDNLSPELKEKIDSGLFPTNGLI